MDHLEDLVVETGTPKDTGNNAGRNGRQPSVRGHGGLRAGHPLWVSHGVICWASNVAIADAEAARRAAGEAMKAASTSLAGKLRTASTLYQSTDERGGRELSPNRCS